MSGSVHCSGCGRAYDVSRFAGGRTLTCACGTRVGGPPAPAPTPAGPPRFFADAMLGRLARWLRTLGFDTAFDPHIADEVLVRRALAEERIVLTRDRGLPREWRLEGCLLLESEGTEAQLLDVVRAMQIPAPLRLFGRCRVCNAPLRAASSPEVAERVPEGVGSRYTRFLACPGCGRVYWEGSHAARMRRVAARVFRRAGGAGHPDTGAPGDPGDGS